MALNSIPNFFYMYFQHSFVRILTFLLELKVSLECTGEGSGCSDIHGKECGAAHNMDFEMIIMAGIGIKMIISIEENYNHREGDDQTVTLD